MVADMQIEVDAGIGEAGFPVGGEDAHHRVDEIIAVGEIVFGAAFPGLVVVEEIVHAAADRQQAGVVAGQIRQPIGMRGRRADA